MAHKTLDAHTVSSLQKKAPGYQYDRTVMMKSHESQYNTVSLKGSQLYTLKPELMPQEKHVLSWLKPTCRSSNPSFLLSEDLAISLNYTKHIDPSQHSIGLGMSEAAGSPNHRIRQDCVVLPSDQFVNGLMS